MNSSATPNPALQGAAHIRTIQTSGGAILGNRALANDCIEPDLMLSHGEGLGVMLQPASLFCGPASDEERRALPVFSTFGYAVMARYAESHPLAAHPHL
jgi:hypothetical protein